MTTTATAPTLIEGLVTQLAFAHYATRVNVEGISDEESLVRPDSGGNCANWILGHITCIREGVLTRLGENLSADERLQQYRRGSDAAVPQPIPFQELIALYDRLQPLFVARLQNLTDAELNGKSPVRSPAGPDATLGAALAFLVFHESYHVGQLGIARRLLGKAGAIA